MLPKNISFSWAQRVSIRVRLVVFGNALERAKADKAQAKNDKLKSTLANIQDKRRNNIKAKLADRQSIRLKKTIARHKAKLKQTQNRPKPSN